MPSSQTSCMLRAGGVTVDASDLELQQYLFDLQGYLVIQNVPKPAEVGKRA